MTVLLPCGRTLSKQLLPRSHLLTRLATTHPSLRVSYPNGGDALPDQSQTASTPFPTVALPIRTYATAARPAGRPKAHTGRTTAKRSTAKKTATKKAAPKRAAKKPKPKKKVKAKAKSKPKSRKRVLSATGLARKEAAERNALRQKALLTGSPKKLPETAWAVCFSEHAPKKGESVGIDGTSAKRASQAYKNLSAEERERLNHIASENKSKNETAYKRWLQTYTPLQIKEANSARDQLKRDAKAAGKAKATGRYNHIKDDRLVKQPPNAYAMFVQDRVASGDLNGMQVKEYGSLLGKEFKELSANQKKPYEDKYAAERNRYFEEFKTVYGYDSPSAKRPSAAAAP